MAVVLGFFVCTLQAPLILASCVSMMTLRPHISRQKVLRWVGGRNGQEWQEARVVWGEEERLEVEMAEQDYKSGGE